MNTENNEVSNNTVQYVDELGNPVEATAINNDYVVEETVYVDELGNPIDPSLIDENGNYIGNVTSISANVNQIKDREFLNGMVTFDYNNNPITDIVNSIILDAINKGASDIHFDPFEEGIKIRIRIDGQLNDYSIVPLYVKKNMITRIKIISGMNITESRNPQDGAIRTELENRTVDLRVSCLPTNMGEKIVIRIMDYSMSAQGIEALDFNENNLNKVKKMLSLPNGIILVTGATGTGKSTTVYSMLQRLNVEGTNLITVEDPIEMNIGGINQVQAVAEIGLDFATVLRSILRQDPDVIMIGEIRDDETARIAVRASITGHLVLSTLHTNNSLNTIERLLDMSVERYLLGSALEGIISQKLSRRLCDKCKKLRPTTDYEKEIFKKALNKDVENIYEPVGCSECSRGYRGRIAIHEVLLLNQSLKDAITKGVSKDILREYVYSENGTETMLQDGLKKVVEGYTSFTEILKLIDLEDDLGTGTQLGLNQQIKDSKVIKDELEEKEEVKEIKEPLDKTEEKVQEVEQKPIAEENTTKEENISPTVKNNEEKLKDKEKSKKLNETITKVSKLRNSIGKNNFIKEINPLLSELENTPEISLNKQNIARMTSLMKKINDFLAISDEINYDIYYNILIRMKIIFGINIDINKKQDNQKENEINDIIDSIDKAVMQKDQDIKLIDEIIDESKNNQIKEQKDINDDINIELEDIEDDLDIIGSNNYKKNFQNIIEKEIDLDQNNEIDLSVSNIDNVIDTINQNFKEDI